MAVTIDYGLPALMSMAEVAELWGISKQRMSVLILSGRVPVRRAGTSWVIRRTVAENLTVDGNVLIDGGGEPVCEIPMHPDTPPGH